MKCLCDNFSDGSVTESFERLQTHKQHKGHRTWQPFR